MLPGRNSRPQHPSKFQANGTAPSPPLQVMGNPASFMPNHMQIQSQMAIPNNNPNTNFSSGQLLGYQVNQMNNANFQQKGQFLGQNIVNPPQFLNQNVGFGGMPNPMQNMNQFLQMQMAMQMASYAQALSGSVPMYPNQVPQGMGIQNSNIALNNAHFGHANASGNLSKQMANGSQQLQGQSPVMNSFGVVQQQQTQNFNSPASANPQVSQAMGPQSSNFGMNAHLGLVNANVAAQQSKSGLSKQMPNVTQQLQGQLPLMNSFGFAQQAQTQNFNAPTSANTQVCQGMGPQIPNFSMNAQLGLLNANGAVQQMPNVNQQMLGQLPMMNPFGFVQPQTQNFNAPASTNTQANRGCIVGISPSKGNQQNSYNSNFSRNQKHDAKNSKFGKGKFSTHNKNLEKGHHRNGEKKNIHSNSVKPEMEKKRPLMVTYSAQEIQQWREERRKNYPSKGNIEKQLTGKMVESEGNSNAAKLRRQQLKEILAKQAELGFEVAEIPSSYLSDTEKQVDGMEQKRPLSRKERFQKRFNKKEKFNRNDRFSKKRRFGNSDSPNTCDQKDFPTGKQDVNRESVTQVTKSARESTLLQKLLSSDIQRDKRRLLQVFRFMTMNSFFKDQPGKPLRFPRVLLKETGKEIEAAEEISDAIDTNIEKSSSDDDNDNYEEDNIAEFTEAVSELQEDSSSESEEPEEEQISS
ncbi:uncharacterized protein [Solanum lycopersicum]|uniref:FMR1-interacting protein 1 conserved domain-containing protein n=1 Tax=Solanum lycopersicum TaxID=4081 RepID=A0A3Q7EM67_SOLLC|nr:GATA zinc finger domain-containing protein 14 isoform X1 [Solanum lycopersicum]